jgi:hypothetical protein
MDNSVKQSYIKYSYVWICKWMSATGGDQLRSVLWRHRRSSQVCSCWSPHWQCNHSDDQHCKIRNIKMTSISQYIFLMCTVFLASHRQKKKKGLWSLSAPIISSKKKLCFWNLHRATSWSVLSLQAGETRMICARNFFCVRLNVTHSDTRLLVCFRAFWCNSCAQYWTRHM